MKAIFCRKQILVLLTALLAFLSIGGIFFFSRQKMGAPVHVDIPGSPVFGKTDAPIEMVLFEDLLCESCRHFNLEVLPVIEERYVATGIVRFTIVPLAFLNGSKPLANAALAVYYIAPTRFFSYVQAICEENFALESESLVQQKLINLAKTIGGIDLLAFRSCVVTDCYYPILEKNFLLAKQVMGRNFGTPTLYLNGLPMTNDSLEAIQEKIKELGLSK